MERKVSSIESFYQVKGDMQKIETNQVTHNLAFRNLSQATVNRISATWQMDI